MPRQHARADRAGAGAARASSGLLPPFPFGTDFTATEQRLIPALRLLQRASPLRLARPRWRAGSSPGTPSPRVAGMPDPNGSRPRPAAVEHLYAAAAWRASRPAIRNRSPHGASAMRTGLSIPVPDYAIALRARRLHPARRPLDRSRAERIFRRLLQQPSRIPRDDHLDVQGLGSDLRAISRPASPRCWTRRPPTPRAKKVEPSVLLNTRLAPDMFPLVRQVRAATDHAVNACGRLSGVEHADILQHRGDHSRAEGAHRQDHRFPQEPQAGADRRQRGQGDQDHVSERSECASSRGQSLLLNNSLPNFYFHCTTAYDILRHCGIELGKRDFMGTPVSL